MGEGFFCQLLPEVARGPLLVNEAGDLGGSLLRELFASPDQVEEIAEPFLEVDGTALILEQVQEEGEGRVFLGYKSHKIRLLLFIFLCIAHK